jgi:hypothetical protein
MIASSAASAAFHCKYTADFWFQPLGKHANFVINFCQILFESKPREIA